MRALHSVLNISEYALTEFWVLNMPEFRIWQISVYPRVTRGSKYAAS